MSLNPSARPALLQTSMSAATWAMLATLSLVWGGSFLFGRIAVLELPPLTVVFFRVALAALALWLFVLATGRKLSPPPRFIVNVAIMGILNNVIPFSFILYGQREIGAGLASIVNAMTPIWTVLIANWLTDDEKLSWRKSAGVICGFMGVAVLMGGDALSGLAASLWAQASVLVATIGYGFAAVFGKRFRGADPLLVSAGQLTASSLIMIPLLFILGMPFLPPMPSVSALAAVVGLALLSTAFAYVLFFEILRRAGATNVSLVTLLVPVSGILLGILVLGEALTAWHLAGMVLIATGLVILDGRLLSRRG